MSQQPQYNIQQWDDKHLNELSVSDQVHLIRMQDAAASKLAKYEPVPDDVQPYESKSQAALDLVVNGGMLVTAGAAIIGVAYVIFAAAAAAVGAVCTVISANAVPITAGIFGFALLWGFVARLMSGGDDSHTSEPKPGAGQTINVTVNVAGQSVTTNSK